MGRKTIVLSVKQDGRVKSWETSRVAAMCLVAPELFANPASMGLLSARRTLRLPLFDALEAHDLLPGGSGWIGIDADRRQIIDFQYYCDPAAYQVTLSEADRAPVFSLPELPEPLTRACLERPWRAKTETASSSMRATRYAPSKTREQLERDLRQAADRAWRDSARCGGAGLPSVGTAWMSIKPDFPPGWRLADCHPTGDPAADARLALRAMALLEKNGWGWHEGLRSQWEAFALDSVLACPRIMGRDRARRAARDLDSRLPATPSSSPAPRL